MYKPAVGWEERLHQDVMRILAGHFDQEKRGEFATCVVGHARTLHASRLGRVSVALPRLNIARNAAARLRDSLFGDEVQHLPAALFAQASLDSGLRPLFVGKGAHVEVVGYLLAPDTKPGGVAVPREYLPLLDALCAATAVAAENQKGRRVVSLPPPKPECLKSIAREYKHILGKAPAVSQKSLFFRVAVAVFKAVTGEGVRYADVVLAVRTAAS